MTPIETRNMVRMLTDDGYDWYPNLIIDAINEAQTQIILKYLQEDNERVLRPLYRTARVVSYDTVNALTVNTVINSQDAFNIEPISIRSVKIYPTARTDDRTYIVASHVDYPTYINYANPMFSTRGRTMPQVAWYTVLKLDDATKPTTANRKTWVVNFSRTNNSDQADVTFVARPVPFACDTTRATPNQFPLSLPNEIHPEVCLLAAEIINNRDVGEQDRSTYRSMSPDQRITIESGGLIQ